jgi:hypothetical protein
MRISALAAAERSRLPKRRDLIEMERPRLFALPAFCDDCTGSYKWFRLKRLHAFACAAQQVV